MSEMNHGGRQVPEVLWFLLVLWVGGMALVFPGCQADCKTACDKLILDCGAGIPSYNATQCEEDCTAVQTYYETYPYLEDELDAFHEELKCIRDTECEALLDPESPACYNRDLFFFNQ